MVPNRNNLWIHENQFVWSIILIETINTYIGYIRQRIVTNWYQWIRTFRVELFFNPRSRSVNPWIGLLLPLDPGTWCLFRRRRSWCRRCRSPLFLHSIFHPSNSSLIISIYSLLGNKTAKKCPIGLLINCEKIIPQSHHYNYYYNHDYYCKRFLNWWHFNFFFIDEELDLEIFF